MKTIRNNKGFTLVELIVVLVILAILAAILVPALLGYIDRAKSAQTVTDARAFYTAAQSALVEHYAVNNDKIELTSQQYYDTDLKQNVARISNGAFKDALDGRTFNDTETNIKHKMSTFNIEMCRRMLEYLDSNSKKNGQYTFTSNALPAGKKPSEYYSKAANKGQPMVAIYYNNKGKVVRVEYADETLNKVTIINGTVTVEQDGQFMKEVAGKK
ncbi:MAG: prepilin-type N-terminal cleavage/methylation domain-containing protein [Eubacteriales bacterium]|nr:prepilin-type N-terminal cleavage/methylation domain-containing protein [Eubacteriales bacterium]